MNLNCCQIISFSLILPQLWGDNFECEFERERERKKVGSKNSLFLIEFVVINSGKNNGKSSSCLIYNSNQARTLI